MSRVSSRRTGLLQWTALVVLLASAISAQVATEAKLPSAEPAADVLWVRSPTLMRRLAIGFDMLLADVYWVRSVQYYGGRKLSNDRDKDYSLLKPLLEMTTALDPDFKVAYRFGAILLSEGYPNGPGKPEDAIALLEKGIARTPDYWWFYHDAGFVEYWWNNDYKAAADWFLRASKLKTAPNWASTVAATMLAEGGSAAAARTLWTQLLETGEQDWMRQTAQRGLMQLDAEAGIEQLLVVVNRFYDRAGRFPSSWPEVVRARMLRGIPVDPTGVPYTLDPVSGQVDVAQSSSLYPLRRHR